MRDAIQSIRMQLQSALDQLDELSRAIAHVPTLSRHADAITQDVPPGFDTVLGYLAKHHPEILDNLEDYSDPQVTARDGWWCAHRTRERGLRPTAVSAPECLRRRGIPHVNAWPLSILAKRWA